MNELINYFVQMGLSPEVAVQLATQVSRTAPPTPPIANGIHLDPNDAVVNLLTTKYGMDPKAAIGYAGHILRHEATGSRALQEEALSAQAGREVTRMHNISNFAEAAKVAPEARTPRQSDNYRFVDDWARDYRKKEADQLAEDDRQESLDQQEEAERSKQGALQDSLDQQIKSQAHAEDLVGRRKLIQDEADRDKRGQELLKRDGVKPKYASTGD